MMRTTVSTQPQTIIVVCCITLRRSAYSAWGNYSVHDKDGKKNTSASFIGHINPLRYRGYYYDRETRLYYLQSRYYDFANCRFINADTFATTDANGFLSANMFAYCENNPIGNSDPDGYFAAALAGGGHLSGILVAGGANFWNPVGWIVVGITVAVGAGFYYYSEHSKRNGSDKRTKDKHQKEMHVGKGIKAAKRKSKNRDGKAEDRKVAIYVEVLLC